MIWLGIFLIILATSFFLAYLSMRNYQESLPVLVSSLYLIRNPAAVNEEFAGKLYQELNTSKSYISLERLFKGDKEALVIFGPHETLKKFPELNLLELEDYAETLEDTINVWEMTIGDKKGQGLPPLGSDEQFWLQMLLQAQNSQDFKAYFRAAAICPDERKRAKLTASLKEGIGQFIFLPRPLSSKKMLDLYKNRSLPPFYSSSSKIGVSSFFKLTAKL